MNRSDLHVHSAHSNDGELGIDQIVQKCIHNQIDTLSVTDHNSIKGNEQAALLCSQSGIHYIPGIEIDCNYNGTDLHLLGYQIDRESRALTNLEEVVEKKLMDSVPTMIENLANEGIQIDVEEVLEKSMGKPPSAELFAEVLLGNRNSHSNPKLKPYMEGGERSDMPYINFYLDFFAQGKSAYVKIDHMSFLEALKLIKSQQGIPIIAHPGLNFRGKEEMVSELLDHGARGLEVFNNYHDNEQMEYLASLTRKRGALMTCGSDFHGKNKPLIEIGKFPLMDAYMEDLTQSIDFILQHGSDN